MNMRNLKVLELLNSGRIDELKKELQDEIYEEALKTKPGAKSRYSAMKKYFKYRKSFQEILQKPCYVTFQDKQYISFTNSWSLALTSESCGEIEMIEDISRYPDVSRLVNFQGNSVKIDISKVIAEAKSEGYKLINKEVDYDYKYLMLFDGSYYKIGLLDATFSIIDDGKPAMSYKVSGSNKPLTLETDIGYCLLMPVKYDGDPETDGKVVIKGGC